MDYVTGYFTRVESAGIASVTNGLIFSHNVNYTGNVVRPVISLKNKVAVVSGTGLQSDPYIID